MRKQTETDEQREKRDFVPALKLSAVSHGFDQQMNVAQLLWNFPE